LKFLQFKIKKTFLIDAGLSFVIACIVLFFSNTATLQQLKSAALDFSFQFKKKLPDKTNIIIIEISDTDIGQVGRWPWSRTWHAAMLQALKGLGAKTVYFDILFSGAATEEEDTIFQEALRASGNSYIPFAFQGFNYNLREAVMPLETFSSTAKGIGSINVYPDSDGIFRKIPLIFKADDGKIYPHMALKIALDYDDMQIKKITARNLIVSGQNQIIDIPLIEKNNFLITWPTRHQNIFKHYSYIDVLAKYKDHLDKKISAEKIKEFKDSI
jgi:CHASE2 domain-containing sensor protein